MKALVPHLVSLFVLLAFFAQRVLTQQGSQSCSIKCENGGFCSNNMCYCKYPFVGKTCGESKSAAETQKWSLKPGFQ